MKASVSIFAGLVLALAFVPAAQATFPGGNGKIAFESQRDGNPEIYQMNPDGSAQTRLTSLAAEDRQPAWNQPGSDLAFSSDRGDLGAESHIYRLHLADATVTPLTFGSTTREVTPSWSPSGTQVVVERNDTDLVLVATDGSGTSTNLTGPLNLNAEEAPNWSPDGQRIIFSAFAAGSAYRDIYSVKPDGTGLVNLTNSTGFDDREPKWSPDGTKIAFASFRDSNYDIHTMNANGSGDTNVSQFPAANDNEPVWSPDGTMIAFVSRREFNNDDIYVMPSGGGLQDRLTTAAGPDIGPDWQRVNPPPPPACADGVDNDGDTKIDFPADPGCASNTDNNEADPPPNGFVRPKGATPFKVSFVPAFNQCTAPNRTHGPPLAFPSCAPPADSSTAVTIGEPSVNGAAANSEGSLRLTVKVGVPGVPDDSDVLINGSVTDVRCKPGTTACGNANTADGADYTGELQGYATMRITDRFNAVSPGGGTDSGTIVDIPFPFDYACANTASPSEGGRCDTVDTSFNAFVPGIAKDGKRMVVEIAEAYVNDGGPDGNAGTAPNTLFLKQGVFVP